MVKSFASSNPDPEPGSVQKKTRFTKEVKKLQKNLPQILPNVPEDGAMETDNNSGLYDLTQDNEDSGSEGEEVDLFDYIDNQWEEDHFNYDHRIEKENNNEKVLAIDKPLWQPEVFPLAKFVGPKYAFRPEMFTPAEPAKVPKKASAAAFPEISPRQFELIGGEEKRLS